MTERRAPKIAHFQPPDDYAVPLVHGFDAWREAWNLEAPPGLWARLEAGRAQALELDDRKKTPAAFTLGGRDMQISAYGAKNWPFVLTDDDMSVRFSTPNKDWAVSVELRSAGLWEHGRDALMQRARDMLAAEGCVPKDDDAFRLSRVDYCFDTWSTAFSAEMVPGIEAAAISPSKAKIGFFGWCSGGALESLYIGRGSACQVRIYDKTKEIVQASGKTWLYALWGERAGYWPGDDPADVWRMEVQLTADWLKERNCNRPGDFDAARQALISDALYNRRLTVPTGDTNRRRWPLHPLYVIALEELDGTEMFLPIGRKVTGKRDAVAAQLARSVAGTARSKAVLMHGENFSEEELMTIAREAVDMAMRDIEDAKKRRRAVERYEFVDEAE